MVSTAGLIARYLADLGCRHAFGIPGGEVLAMIDALREHGIEFTLVKHENSAGFMAEGIWHGTGKPAILVATIGPGLTNAVNTIANASQEQVPLVVLTGCVDPVDRLSYTHQVIDHQAVLRPLVKASFEVADGDVPAMMVQALTAMLSDPPGPIHIDLPVKLAEKQQPDTALTAPVLPARPTLTDQNLIARMAAHIDRAERPVMIVGMEVLYHQADRIVAAFASANAIPVITTYKAKGVLAEDHTLALGGAGLSPKADRLIMPLLAASDCILLVGYDPIEMRVGWRDPWPDPAVVIEFAATTRRHGMHRAGIEILGDIGQTLGDIGAALKGGARHWPSGEAGMLRAALKSAFAPQSEWGPAAIFAAARRLAPRNAIATADSGAHRILLSQQWECYQPRDLRQSSAFCTMGVSVPLAAGSKLAEPERAVIAFVGDAGLEMGIGELATLRDLGLAVVIIVLVDRSLALIEMKQRASGLANTGVDFAPTDFAAITRAYGGDGYDVDDIRAFEAALSSALTAPRFSVIACSIDQRSYDGLI